jgi:hypothetical protein
VYVMSVTASVTGVVTMKSMRHNSPKLPAKPAGAPSEDAE